MISSKKTTLLICSFVLAIAACAFMVGCGQSSSSASSASSASASSASASASSASSATGSSAATSGEAAKLGVAYQYGLSYAPVVIAKEQGLIEKNYKASTGNDVTVEWNQMSSGADINTGITSGSLDVGFMGIAPAITGITTGLDYKVFANISGQEHGLMTNNANINGLSDIIGSNEQIALVNIGSIQHLILAKALVDNGYDAHALDSNIVAMKHPDGMAALQSGSLACHLTSSPYIFTERKDSALHELSEVNKAWTKDDSFIVGVASSALNEDKALYGALCDAITEAQEYIAANPEEAAAILCEFDSNTPETELEYLKQGSYADKTSNLFKMATFMAENGFINKAPSAYSDLVFSNVKGD